MAQIHSCQWPRTGSCGEWRRDHALIAEPRDPIEVTLASTNPTEGTIAPSTITFTGDNWDRPQTVTVTGVDDVFDDDDQLYLVEVDAGTWGQGEVALANRDDDTAAVAVTQTAADLQVSETGTTATFSIVLTSRPTADVTIPLSSSDDGEVSVSPTSITISPATWDAARTITVTGVNDDVADGDQNAVIGVGAATSTDGGYALIDGQQPFTVVTAPAVSTDLAYDGLDADDVTVYNFDDESPGVYIQARGLLKTIEGQNQPAFIRMRLTIAPTAPVTCLVSSSDTSEVTVEPTMFVFDASNFDVSQTITVRGVDDALMDGDQEIIIITHPCTSADPVYNLFDPRNIRVLNRDDD